MVPTNNSINKKGIGSRYGRKNPINNKRTSPAYMFPKSLNEKENIFVNSERISKNPSTNLRGLEKFI